MGLLDIGIDAERRGKRESWRWRPRLSSAASKAMSDFKSSAPRIRTYTPNVTAGSPFSTRHSVAREMAERSATRACVNLRRLRARRSRSPRAARSNASSGNIFGDLAGIVYRIISLKTVFVNNVIQIAASSHHHRHASSHSKRHQSWHLLFMIWRTDHGEAGIAARGVDPSVVLHSVCNLFDPPLTKATCAIKEPSFPRRRESNLVGCQQILKT